MEFKALLQAFFLKISQQQEVYRTKYFLSASLSVEFFNVFSFRSHLSLEMFCDILVHYPAIFQDEQQ